MFQDKVLVLVSLFIVEETWKGKKSSITLRWRNVEQYSLCWTPLLQLARVSYCWKTATFQLTESRRPFKRQTHAPLTVKLQTDEVSSSSDFLSMIVETFSDGGKISAKYNSLLKQRNTILQEILVGEDYGNGLIYVDCKANVNYLIPKLLPKEMYSYYRKKRCNRCQEEIQSDRCFVDINIDLLEHESIQN